MSHSHRQTTEKFRSIVSLLRVLVQYYATEKGSSQKRLNFLRKGLLHRKARELLPLVINLPHVWTEWKSHTFTRKNHHPTSCVPIEDKTFYETACRANGEDHNSRCTIKTQQRGQPHTHTMSRYVSKKRQLPLQKSFPTTMNAYRLHFSCENIGKYIGSTKRRIKWWVRHFASFCESVTKGNLHWV